MLKRRTSLDRAREACKDRVCKDCGSTLHVEQWNNGGSLFMLKCIKTSCRMWSTPQGKYIRELALLSPLIEFNGKPMRKKYHKSPTKL